MGSNEQSTKIESLPYEEDDDDDDDEGPPPGFDSIKQLPINSLTDTISISEIKINQDEDHFVDNDDDDDDDGPPPGFQLKSIENEELEEKEDDDDDDDGPPPGFGDFGEEIENCDSIPVIREELESGSNSDLKSRKLGFRSVLEKGDDGGDLGIENCRVNSVIGGEMGGGSRPDSNSVSVSSDGSEKVGLRTVSERGGDDGDVGISNCRSNSVIEVKMGGGSRPDSDSVMGSADGSEKVGFLPVRERVGNDDNMEINNSSFINEVGGEIETGLKSEFDSVAVGDGSGKLGFEPISEEGEIEKDDVEMPRSNTISIVGAEIEDGLGFQTIPERRERKRDDFELGSQSITVQENEKKQSILEKEECDDDDEEGPPPGWGSFFRPKPPIGSLEPPKSPSYAFSRGIAHVKGEEKVRDECELASQSVTMIEDRKKGGESGLEFQSFSVEEEERGGDGEGPSSPSSHVKRKEEKDDDDDDEGPPPGWDSFFPPRSVSEAPMPPQLSPLPPLLPKPASEAPLTPQLSLLPPPPRLSPPSAALSAHVKGEEKARDECELASQSVRMKEDKREGDGSGFEFQSFSVEEEEKGGDVERPSSPSGHVKRKREKDDEYEGPPPGWDSYAPPRPASKAPAPRQLSPSPPLPPPSSAPSGKAQMVCGSCQRLLSYSKGSRFVQCSCCETVNLVLEEHQVGQVKCRGCTVLLMYPFGAPSVQCSSCLFVTKVGEENKRPPLSIQQGRRQMKTRAVH